MPVGARDLVRVHVRVVVRAQRQAGNRRDTHAGCDECLDIHLVHKTGDVTAVSLHLYGADLSDSAATIRREYDLPVR